MSATPSTIRAARALAFAVILASCARPAPVPRPEPGLAPEPSPRAVDHVLLVVGDAGASYPDRSPVLDRLEEEMDRWSTELRRDSAVSVVFLGDVIYPSGLHERGHPEFPRDSVRLWAQLRLFDPGDGRVWDVPGFFLAGNHDWGNTAGPDGIARLRNLEEYMSAVRRREGRLVELVPAAGRSGPVVQDLGSRLRLVMIDTHWWLQNRSGPRLDTLLQGMREALRTAGEREVVVAAHHPFRSGGAHGGPMPFWRGAGVLFLLRKGGALVQDLNSVAYRELLEDLEGVFADEGRPLAFLGGHDHSLQVIRGVGEDHPEWSVVSGSGSKLTGVSGVEGMIFGAERPGFMRLLFLEDGGVLLHVIAGSPEALTCAAERGVPDPGACMARAEESFETIWGTRLR